MTALLCVRHLERMKRQSSVPPGASAACAPARECWPGRDVDKCPRPGRLPRPARGVLRGGGSGDAQERTLICWFPSIPSVVCHRAGIAASVPRRRRGSCFVDVQVPCGLFPTADDGGPGVCVGVGPGPISESMLTGSERRKVHAPGRRECVARRPWRDAESQREPLGRGRQRFPLNNFKSF